MSLPFTAQLGTDLSMPGNIALGYQLVTVTSILDSGQWAVTLAETLLGGATGTDSALGSTTLTEAGTGRVTVSDSARDSTTISDSGDPG